MKRMVMTLITTALLGCCSCQQDLMEYEQGDLKVSIEQGEEWLHDFKLFMGINKKNAPQIAVWIEDIAGNYLTTIYASHKIATQTWTAAGGNRRREALPHCATSGACNMPTDSTCRPRTNPSTTP